TFPGPTDARRHTILTGEVMRIRSTCLLVLGLVAACGEEGSGPASAVQPDGQSGQTGRGAAVRGLGFTGTAGPDSGTGGVPGAGRGRRGGGGRPRRGGPAGRPGRAAGTGGGGTGAGVRGDVRAGQRDRRRAGGGGGAGARGGSPPGHRGYRSPASAGRHDAD